MKNTDKHNYEECRALIMKLSEYIDNELDFDEYNKLKEHLETCGCCSNCLETLKQTIALCKAMENESLPSSLSSKLSVISETCMKENT